MVEVIQDFVNINRDDSDQLREFFLKHAYFSINDLAMILGFSTRYMRRLRKLAGLGSDSIAAPIRPLVIDDAQPFRDTPEWWTEHADRFGERKLVRITGLGVRAVRNRLKKYRTKQLMSNPCRTREWLTKHYVQGGLTATDCARLAGVSPSTLTNWLVHFGIRPRHRGYRPCVPNTPLH